METGSDGELYSSGFSPYEAYLSLLTQELEQIEIIGELQVLVRGAVIQRDWEEFETLINSLDELSGEFELLDQERIRLFALSDSNFYTLAATFPEAQRRTITEVYRQLKLDSMKIRLANEALIGYLQEARTVAEGFLDAVFPVRKHKTYSRRGYQVEADVRSMIFNQQC